MLSTHFINNIFQKSKNNYLLQTGFISLILYCGISFLSKEFIYGTGHTDRPIILFLFLYLLLFVFYFLAINFIVKKWGSPSPVYKMEKRNVSPLQREKGDLRIILLFAVLFRLAFLPSNPIQEDDYYRYMWDGKVSQHGVNPYKYSPAEINRFKEDDEKREYDYVEIKELELLNHIRFENHRSEILFDRINHPEVPTIYPPFSQIIFLLAEFSFGGKIMGLRATVLVFDLLTIWMVLCLLKRYKLNPLYSIIYAWSPLVIKEHINSLHIDSIPLLFLISSLYLLVSSRLVLSMFVYALSVLSKYYSLILFPIIFSYAYKGKKSKFFLAAIVFLGTIFIFYFPFTMDGITVFNGLVIYGNQWERNDSLFAALKFFTGNHQLSVLIILIVLTGVIGYVTYTEENIVKKILIILSAFFLLSPTQYPWYFICVLPFLSFYPNRSLLLLSCLLSFYYLEFYLIYHQMSEYIYMIRWFEYLPFYSLLIYDIVKKCER